MAAAADEPAAKMAKKEQQDYTLTHPLDFKRFLKAMLQFSPLFPPIIIDGLEVRPKLNVSLNRLVVEFIATDDCRNGLMFPKHCGHNAYEFYKIYLETEDENGVCKYEYDFNKFMAFMHQEVPHMKIYGNKLVLAKDFAAMTAQEEALYAANPALDRCGQCGQINDGTLMEVLATTGFGNPKPGACLKCYLANMHINFDTDVENHKLVYDDNRYKFDPLGSCKFAERVEGGLIAMDIHECDCNYDDDDDDDDDEDPPVYNGPPPVIDENAEAARAA
jgi:hypothetical protein